MGWKSTVDVKRSFALGEIMVRLHELSDEALADVLERVLDDVEECHGYNYTIRPKDDGDNPCNPCKKRKAK